MHALLVWFDRLPYGLLGCSGNVAAVTGGFDRLAAGSVTFDNCFAADVRENGPTQAIVAAISATFKHGTAVRVISECDTSLCERLSSVQGGIMEPVANDDRPLAERLIATYDAVMTEKPSAGDCLTVVSLRGLTTGEVATEADQFIAELTTRWRETSGDDSLLIVTAAEGEPTADECSDEPPFSQLAETRIHVPLFVSVGPFMEYGVRSRALVSTADVATTLMDWLNMTDGSETAGRSLLQHVSGESTESRDALLLRGRQSVCGIRTRDWYLMTRCEDGLATDEQAERAAESAALFVKPDDIWDQLDMAGQSPDVVDRLIGRLLESLEPSDSAAHSS